MSVSSSCTIICEACSRLTEGGTALKVLAETWGSVGGALEAAAPMHFKGVFFWLFGIDIAASGFICQSSIRNSTQHVKNDLLNLKNWQGQDHYLLHSQNHCHHCHQLGQLESDVINWHRRLKDGVHFFLGAVFFICATSFCSLPSLFILASKFSFSMRKDSERNLAMTRLRRVLACHWFFDNIYFTAFIRIGIFTLNLCHEVTEMVVVGVWWLMISDKKIWVRKVMRLYPVWGETDDNWW